MKFLLLIFAAVFIFARLLTARPDIKGLDIKSAMKNGGIIIDVRTPGEFLSGSIPGSTNFPLDTIADLAKSMGISRDLPVILCCATGARSARAVKILRKEGYRNVHNGGSVHSLRSVM